MQSHVLSIAGDGLILIAHDYLYFSVFELKESEKLERYDCTQKKPRTSIDSHFDRQAILAFIVEYSVEHYSLVIHRKLRKLVDGNQIPQPTVGVDVKMIELNIRCEVLPQHRRLSSQCRLFHQPPHHILDFHPRILHGNLNRPPPSPSSNQSKTVKKNRKRRRRRRPNHKNRS